MTHENEIVEVRNLQKVIWKVLVRNLLSTKLDMPHQSMGMLERQRGDWLRRLGLWLDIEAVF